MASSVFHAGVSYLINPFVVERDPYLKLKQARPVSIFKRMTLTRDSQGYRGVCPFHHGTNATEFQVRRYEDQGGIWLFNCFACGTTGSVIEFVQKSDQVDRREAVRIVREELKAAGDPTGDDTEPAQGRANEPRAELPLEKYHDIFEVSLESGAIAQEWLKSRGISLTTAQRLHFGYLAAVPRSHKVPAYLRDQGWIVFPCIIDDRVVSLKIRSLVEKVFTREEKMQTTLFNLPAIDPILPIFVTEGEMDTAALTEAGFNSLSLPSASFHPQPALVKQLASTVQVVLAGDNDEPGRNIVDAWAGALVDAGATVKIVTWPSGMKDANQTLLEYCGSDINVFRDLVNVLVANAKVEQPGTEARRTDTGNAIKLILQADGKARYCHTMKNWFMYNGQRWVLDEERAIYRLSKATTQAMFRAAAEIEDPEERKALFKHAFRSESARGIKAMEDLARDLAPVTLTTFDFDPNLLNLQNGTLNLGATPVEFCGHRREDFISKIANVHYNPSAKCARWQEFLKVVLDGDTDTIKSLQQAAGYWLTGDTTEHCMWIFYGSGRNGKSTFLNVLRELLGDYGDAIDPTSLMALKAGQKTIRNDLAKLRGTRFVTSIESEEGQRLAESMIKGITGGDPVVSRFLFKEEFTYTPHFKVVLGTNHKPTVRGTDVAIWSRLRLVPFEVFIPEDKRDLHLKERLICEEGAGILNWMLEGHAQWRQNGKLFVSRRIREATKEYRSDQDAMAYFLAQKTDASDKNANVETGKLYSVYKNWAQANGEYVLNMRAFSRTLNERGFQKTSNRLKWIGLRIKDGPDTGSPFDDDDDREGLDFEG